MRSARGHGQRRVTSHVTGSIASRRRPRPAARRAAEDPAPRHQLPRDRGRPVVLRALHIQRVRAEASCSWWGSDDVQAHEHESLHSPHAHHRACESAWTQTWRCDLQLYQQALVRMKGVDFQRDSSIAVRPLPCVYGVYPLTHGIPNCVVRRGLLRSWSKLGATALRIAAVQQCMTAVVHDCTPALLHDYITCCDYGVSKDLPPAAGPPPGYRCSTGLAGTARRRRRRR